MNKKPKIRYKGQKNSDPEAHAGYEEDSPGDARITRKVKRYKSSGKTEATDDVSKLYADIMSVVQNNGHVTLPGMAPFEGFVTYRQVRAVGFLLGLLGLVALLKVAKRVV